MIEWGFLFPTLSKLGFFPTWIHWISSLYQFVSSSVKVNGELGEDFKLTKSVRQGCPLAPYMFILVMDVLGHMLDDPKHEIEGLHLPKGGCVRDQTFTNDIALYLKGSLSNLSKAWVVLKLFYLAYGAKVNWGKSTTIWANKEKKEWEWGQEVGLRWILEGQGVRYLGIQIGFQLPAEVNFGKLMRTLKGKMIAWGKCNFSFTNKFLVANQVLFSSMWYLVAYWNPNPRMCNHIKGVVRNFIWGGKASNTRAKVKWDFLTLPLSSGGLRIIEPQA